MRNTPYPAVAAIIWRSRSCQRSELVASGSMAALPTAKETALRPPTMPIDTPVYLSTVSSQEFTPHSAARAAKL